MTVNNVAPTATLSNNGPVNIGANVTISFSNQNDVSTPDKNAGFKYSYDFDNNGTWELTDVTAASATTSYAIDGSKTVKARVKDKDGGFTDYTTTFQVNDPSGDPFIQTPYDKIPELRPSSDDHSRDKRQLVGGLDMVTQSRADDRRHRQHRRRHDRDVRRGRAISR